MIEVVTNPWQLSIVFFLTVLVTLIIALLMSDEP